MQDDRVPRVVPRVVVEMQPEQHIAMLTVFKTDVIQLLARECKRRRFDGLVSALHSRSARSVMRMSCTLVCAGIPAPADSVVYRCQHTRTVSKRPCRQCCRLLAAEIR